ncbi:ATP-binding cassette domain-containing protein [bacterium]|nr:ATP-binding cassette domain-containing protein [bacterium]
MNVLKVDKIRKQFGDHVAVDEVSFSIDEGMIFGLIGPNGAGKTTSIRMIMNIIAPDSGNVSVMGNTDPRKHTDLIGYLPEERGLYRRMKIKDLLRFMTDLKQVSKVESAKAVDYWLERVELSEWKNKKVEELSKGMQQKIQFIGTILHKPKLLILDEPFGGLDPVNQILIKDILLDLKKQGTTIIFSTHVMESAEKLCEDILLINKSKQVLYGKLAEIKKSFGHQHLIIEYSGKDTFLDSKEIAHFDNYGNHVEIQLTKNGDAQKILKEAVTMADIQRFELKEPSLQEIFIETVGESAGEAGNE